MRINEKIYVYYLTAALVAGSGGLIFRLVKDITRMSETGIVVVGEENNAYYYDFWNQGTKRVEEVNIPLPMGRKITSSKSSKASITFKLLDEKYTLTREQYVFFEELYPNSTTNFDRDFVQSLSAASIDNMVEDYWENFQFNAKDYNIIRVENLDTKTTSYLCGYQIKEENKYYNFETNSIEDYTNSVVYQEENMEIFFENKQATREEIISAFHNYLNENMTLSKSKTY